MSEAVREMTRDELVAEKAELEEQCRVLANRCDMKERQIREMQPQDVYKRQEYTK